MNDMLNGLNAMNLVDDQKLSDAKLPTPAFKAKMYKSSVSESECTNEADGLFGQQKFYSGLERIVNIRLHKKIDDLREQLLTVGFFLLWFKCSFLDYL